MPIHSQTNLENILVCSISCSLLLCSALKAVRQFLIFPFFPDFWVLIERLSTENAVVPWGILINFELLSELTIAECNWLCGIALRCCISCPTTIVCCIGCYIAVRITCQSHTSFPITKPQIKLYRITVCTTSVCQLWYIFQDTVQDYHDVLLPTGLSCFHV